MLNSFNATLSPMLVMFMCIVIGFFLTKKKLLPENAATVLSKLENYVLVPALVISTFMKYCTVSSLKLQYKTILYSTAVTLLGIGISYLISGLFTKDSYQKNIYKYALSFGNFGFMGNAIVPAILGKEVLYTYMLFTLPLNIAVYTWGLAILIPKGEKRENPLKNLLNPIFFGIIIGAVLGLLGVEEYIPKFFTTTIENLSSCMGPVAMLLTGFVIGGYKFTSLLKDKKIYFAAFLRLFIFPAVFVALLKLIGADNTVLKLCLFAFATPLGLNTVVFPAAYGGDTKTGASMAMISHTVCVITIPLMYALLTTLI